MNEIAFNLEVGIIRCRGEHAASPGDDPGLWPVEVLLDRVEVINSIAASREMRQFAMGILTQGSVWGGEKGAERFDDVLDRLNRMRIHPM